MPTRALRKRRRAAQEAVIQLDIEALDGGRGFVATSDDVPGLVAQGRTLAETVEIAQDVARRIVESCVEHGDPLPAAFSHPRKRSPIGVPVAIPQLRR